MTTTTRFGASSRRAKAIRAARRTRPHVSAGRSGTHRARYSERRSELERFHRSEGEAREPKADVSAWGPRNPAHFTFSTCSRASPAGRGWTAAAGSANASAPGWKGDIAISRTHRQVRRNARVTAAGSTARFRDAFFSRRPLFLAFFRVRLTRDFLSSPTPAEEEEQVYAQLATLRDHLPTRYAPRRPGNARVERTPRLPSTRPSAVCRTHSPRFGPGRRRRVEG